MKHSLFLFLTILSGMSNALAQHTFNNSGTGGGAQVGIGTNSPQFARLHVEAQTVGNGDGERLFYGTIPDAPNEFIAITNGSSQDKTFIPTIYGAKHGANNGSALLLMGSIVPALDLATNTPIMNFNVRRNYAPDGSLGAFSAVQNRPIFQWSNFATPLMTMLPNGNLGIATATPSAILHTVGSVRLQGLPVGSHRDVVVIDNNGNLATRAYPTAITLSCTTSNYLSKVTAANALDCSQVFDNGTFVGIGTITAPTGIRLNVNGNIQALGITTLSDKRYKTNTSSISGALAVVMSLKPISYEWTKSNNDGLIFDSNRHFGLSAQDLEKEVPEVVQTSETGIKSVNYTELIPLLINAIQEQQKEIEALKAQLIKKQ